MSKNFQAVPPFRAHENVLISRSQLRKTRRRQSLSTDAQYCAKKLIQDATKEAERIRQLAFGEGYRDGVLACAESLLAYLDGGRELARQLQEEIRESARVMLRETLDQPETILAVLEDWLHNHVNASGQPLQLKLPRGAHNWRMRVMALVETWGPRVQVDYHDDPRFLLRCGNVVAEFDPVAVTEKGEYLLLRQLDQLPVSCRRLSDDATQKLRTLFEQRFATSTEADASAVIPPVASVENV